MNYHHIFQFELIYFLIFITFSSSKISLNKKDIITLFKRKTNEEIFLKKDSTTITNFVIARNDIFPNSSLFILFRLEKEISVFNKDSI